MKQYQEAYHLAEKKHHNQLRGGLLVPSHGGAPGGYDGSSVIEIGSLLGFVELSEEYAATDIVVSQAPCVSLQWKKTKDGRENASPEHWRHN
jgi:hypothetical protein